MTELQYRALSSASGREGSERGGGGCNGLYGCMNGPDCRYEEAPASRKHYRESMNVWRLASVRLRAFHVTVVSCRLGGMAFSSPRVPVSLRLVCSFNPLMWP